MSAWGDERDFSVPPEVDACGFAEMVAHFKLGRVGMVSPSDVLPGLLVTRPN